MEKYSRGRRGAPAKGVGRETGARVQIPPSPFLMNRFLMEWFVRQLKINEKTFLKKIKKGVDNGLRK